MTADQVLALAPDPASAKAGQGLASPRKWVASGSDGALLWGECQGSGSTPYQTRIELATIAYKCSCPSRKFPCKHVLGLMLLQAGGGVASGDAPEWARAWLAERAAKAAPSYDPRNAADLAALGIPAFACTPDLFPELMAATIERRDVAAWAASCDIVVAT